MVVSIESGGTSYVIDGLEQERYNSSASAMELRLSCTKPLIYCKRGDRS